MTNWNTLQAQAVARNIDLIGRGTIKGQKHGLIYKPATNTYLTDTNQTLTQAQLQSLIMAGDIMSVMGVYPGSGTVKY